MAAQDIEIVFKKNQTYDNGYRKFHYNPLKNPISGFNIGITDYDSIGYHYDFNGFGELCAYSCYNVIERKKCIDIMHCGYLFKHGIFTSIIKILKNSNNKKYFIKERTVSGIKTRNIK